MNPAPTNPFLALFDDLRESLLAGLDEAKSAENTEAFHRLRVSIKKIRSLISLGMAIDPELDGGKPYRQICALFRAAAPVRDLQVQGALAAREAESSRLDIDGYLRHLKTGVEKSVGEFLDHAEQFDRKATTRLRKRLASSVESIGDDAAAALTSARLRTMLRSIAAWDETEADPHDLRTLAKQAFFTWDAIDRCLPGTITAAGTKRRLHSLQRLLGRWHDYHIAVRMAGSYRDESGDDSQGLERLLHSLNVHQERLLKRSLRARKRLARRIRRQF
jgi:CHAD domain-containing protein